MRYPAQLLGEAIEEGTTSSSSWAPPLWIPYAAMTIGMALLTVQLALQVLGAPTVWERRQGADCRSGWPG